MLADMKTEGATIHTIKLGEVVEVRHARAPRRDKHDVEWLAGETISAESWYGRSRYVVHLYDGRRVVAFDDEVRPSPSNPGDAMRLAS
jgi:hypothetical protein